MTQATANAPVTFSATNALPCPVCDGWRFQRAREVTSTVEAVPEGLDRVRTVRVRIERCAGCGLYRTVHLSDGRTSSELYEKSSVCYEASVSKVRVAGTQPVSSTDELSLLRVKPPAHLLDVGCGAGQFLLRASHAGYDVTGIDVDPRAVQFAREELQLDVRCGGLESLQATEHFDVVTLLGVVEHLAQPLEVLGEIRERLTQGGEVLIGVPNVASLNRWVSRLSRHDWDMFLEPGHLYQYNIRTLAALAARAELSLRQWATGTMTIRGKIPFLPVRDVTLERRIRRAVQAHEATRRVYMAGLRVLDRLRIGDMLFATFTRGDVP